ncbi:hypothetical protein HZC09_01035 [Candidatus Micrarchaeota archaeon]|nr:hypothetical protein [Candidatus Micrarchaeota archaeon]
MHELLKKTTKKIAVGAAIIACLLGAVAKTPAKDHVPATGFASWAMKKKAKIIGTGTAKRLNWVHSSPSFRDDVRKNAGELHVPEEKFAAAALHCVQNAQKQTASNLKQDAETLPVTIFTESYRLESDVLLLSEMLLSGGERAATESLDGYLGRQTWTARLGARARRLYSLFRKRHGARHGIVAGISDENVTNALKEYLGGHADEYGAHFLAFYDAVGHEMIHFLFPHLDQKQTETISQKNTLLLCGKHKEIFKPLDDLLNKAGKAKAMPEQKKPLTMRKTLLESKRAQRPKQQAPKPRPQTRRFQQRL